MTQLTLEDWYQRRLEEALASEDVVTSPGEPFGLNVDGDAFYVKMSFALKVPINYLTLSIDLKNV